MLSLRFTTCRWTTCTACWWWIVVWCMYPSSIFNIFAFAYWTKNTKVCGANCWAVFSFLKWTQNHPKCLFLSGKAIIYVLLYRAWQIRRGYKTYIISGRLKTIRNKNPALLAKNLRVISCNRLWKESIWGVYHWFHYPYLSFNWNSD